MPAEWEPHEGTWLAWPHNTEHWPGKFEPIPFVYVEIVRALLEAEERVFIEVRDSEMQLQVGGFLNSEGIDPMRIDFFDIPNNASWVRDHGPIFVWNEKLTLTNWEFNCWGGKYPPWDLDNAVPHKIGAALDLPVVDGGMVLEGGAIDVNGKGTLLTTESCLLNQNRNPNLSKQDIEARLRDYLGATNVIWLPEGIEGDDTDGHIDDIARFVNPTTILCSVEPNPTSPNHQILKRNFEILQAARDQDGNALTIVEMPMPQPVIHEGEILPASYANFYIANSAVLLPTFRCPEDEIMKEILEAYFPNRKIIGIDCVDLVWGLGTLHCSTQQQPLE